SLAIMDIVEYFRHVYGSASQSPCDWARDQNFHSRISHFTFAEYAATDYDYHAKLDDLYARYSIPAWDFVGHWDFTADLHMPHFRSWRGRRYRLPNEASDAVAGAFGDGGHELDGYRQAAGWM
ncbi:hypothetical protein K490DRAFT_3619, partial [Saccharata proteae CBS 121410]